MVDVLKNIVPQASILDNEENPAVVGAGSTDFGETRSTRGPIRLVQKGWIA